MSSAELVIFDFDGTLVDSEAIGIKIEVDLLNAAGCDISYEGLAERFSGLNWADILRILENETGIALVQRFGEAYESILDDRLPKEVEIISGVRDALAMLKLPSCICSNTKLSRLQAMLQRVELQSYFKSNVFSAKDLGEGRTKPKPDIFLHGASKMKVKPNKTVVVEDSVHGVQAGRAADMFVVGFTGGAHTYPNHANRLFEAGAHVVIPHMTDLMTAVSEFHL